MGKRRSRLPTTPSAMWTTLVQPKKNRKHDTRHTESQEPSIVAVGGFKICSWVYASKVELFGSGFLSFRMYRLLPSKFKY